MVLLLFVGLWLAFGPDLGIKSFQRTPGAERYSMVLASRKATIERLDASAPRPPGVTREGTLYRFATKGEHDEWMSPSEFDAEIARQLAGAEGRHWLLRIANASEWWGIIWVSIGLLGQVLFMGRMLIQWVVSEKEQKSRITPAFWWFSLIGGAMLFAYFVWRQDPIGVLGQSTGVVIYARNIRLIYKERARRARAMRQAAEHARPVPPEPAL